MARCVLVGLPGSGKSSVGRIVARTLDVTFIDTDDDVARRVNCSVGDFLRREGEPRFRDVEYEVLCDALLRDAVIATGGGIVTSLRAREALQDTATMWLDCADEVLLTRLGAGDRPLLAGDPSVALARLRGERTPWYDAVARVRVDASGTANEVAQRVLHALNEAAA